MSAGELTPNRTDAPPLSAQLYNAIYQYTMTRDAIAELTVEDPSEAFEDLRDKCDLRMLFKHGEFLKEAYGEDVDVSSGVPRGGKGKLGPPADKEWVERWRKKLKMAGVRDCCRLDARARSDSGILICDAASVCSTDGDARAEELDRGRCEVDSGVQAAGKPCNGQRRR